jgi:tetratricopeptide (TPR) repeat protein
MHPKRLSIILLVSFLATVPGLLAYARNPQAQLNQYVNELQKSPGDTTLREKIIGYAQTMKPAPPVPEAFERFMARGKTAFEMAKSTGDFASAVAEFEKGVDAAPWIAAGYYNLGQAQESVGQFAQAIQSFKFYLIANPSAKDAQTVKNHIYGLEYKLEQATKGQQTAAEEQRKAQQAAADAQRKAQQGAAFVQGLAGRWITPEVRGWFNRFLVNVNGKSMEIFQTESCHGGICDQLGQNQVWRADVNGLTLSGTYTIDQTATFLNGAAFTRPFTGSISPDGRLIHMEFVQVAPTGVAGDRLASGWMEHTVSQDIERP